VFKERDHECRAPAESKAENKLAQRTRLWPLADAKAPTEFGNVLNVF